MQGFWATSLGTLASRVLGLVRDIVTAVPSAWPIIEGINNNIMSGDLYRALKDARKLIAYEEKLRDQYQATHPKGDVSSAA